MVNGNGRKFSNGCSLVPLAIFFLPGCTVAIRWPTSQGNIHKNFWPHLETELLTHSVFRHVLIVFPPIGRLTRTIRRRHCGTPFPPRDHEPTGWPWLNMDTEKVTNSTADLRCIRCHVVGMTLATCTPKISCQTCSFFLHRKLAVKLFLPFHEWYLEWETWRTFYFYLRHQPHWQILDHTERGVRSLARFWRWGFEEFPRLVGPLL